MAQYKTGTVSVTNGSATVTGSGTAFSANLTAGDLFTVAGDSVAYTVASAPTATTLTLTAPYGGVTGSGKSYGVTIDFTPDLGLPLMSIGDLNTAAIYNEAMKNVDNLNLANLGTAAFADLTTSTTDTTAGRAVNVSNFQNGADLGLGVRVILKNDTAGTVSPGTILDGSTGDLDIIKITAGGLIQGAGAGTIIGTWKNMAARTLQAGEFGEFLRVT